MRNHFLFADEMLAGSIRVKKYVAINGYCVLNEKDLQSYMNSSHSLFLLTLGCRSKTRCPDVDGVGVPLNIIILEPTSFGLFHGMSFEVQLYRDSSEGRGCANGNAGGLKKY